MKAKDGCESHVVREVGALFDDGGFVVVGPSGLESRPFRDRATAEKWARRMRREYAARHENEAVSDAVVAAALDRARRRRGGVR